MKVKFFVSKATTQTTCLWLMGKKMLVALMMEGKFSGEGIHSLESDDDMMSTMPRELVERGRVGESGDAVWADLKRERARQMLSMLMVSQTAPRGRARSIVASSAAGAGHIIGICAASRRVQSE